MERLCSLLVSMPLLLLVAASALSVPVSLADESCRVQLPEHLCPEDQADCFKKLECRHGRCDSDKGCVCDPCWSGQTCDQYVDKYAPSFPAWEATHEVEDTLEGLRYQLQATDSDLGFTCPLGVAGPPARCPCAVVEYRLRSSDTPEDAVRLDAETGLLTVTDFDRLTPGKRYLLQIEAHAEPPVDADVVPRRDFMNLTLLRAVDVDDELQEALEEAENIEAGSADAIYPPSAELKELSRAKRDSSGGSAETTTMTLTRTSSSSVSSPKIGGLLTYDFKITLPTLSSGMDMKVEIFVADLDSGETVFDITKAKVVSVGSGVSSTAGDLTNVAPQEFFNSISPEYRDRVVLDLGSLTNSDPESGGTAGGSDILINFAAVVVKNTDVSAGTQQFISAGAEYNTANYVWVTQESFTPDSTTTDISSNVADISATTASLTVAQYTAGVAELTIKVKAAMAELYVEAYVSHALHEDALSIGGTFVTLGSSHLEPHNFNADRHKVAQVRSSSGLTTRFRSVNFAFKQTGDSSAALADEGRLITIKIPVAATAVAMPGGTATLVVFARAKDTLTSSFISAGSQAKIGITVEAGPLPSPSGSLTLDGSPTLASSSLDVPGKSTVVYEVKALAPSASSYVETQDITLDTSAPGLRACNVEVLSQGANIVYMEVSGPTISGESSAHITITKLITQEVTSEAIGYELIFRMAVRADSSGAPTANPGSVSLPPVNVTGAGAGEQPTVEVMSSGPTTVNIGQQFGIDMKVKYPVDDLVSTTDADFAVEFTSDLRLDYEVKFCSVHVVSVGRDIPCASGKTAAGLSVTFAKTNDTRVNDDVAVTTLPLTCASAMTLQTEADRTLHVRAVAQIIPEQTVGETAFKPGAGLEFDESMLFAGLVDLTMAGSLTGFSGSTDPAVQFPEPPPMQFGKVEFVDVFLHVPPGVSSPNLRLKATSLAPDTMRVDRVVVRRVGRNFGCLGSRLLNADQLAEGEKPSSYPTFSVDEDGTVGSSATIDLGPVTNVAGSGGTSLNTIETTDLFVEDDHIVLSVAVQCFESGSSTLAVQAYKDSANAIGSPIEKTVSFTGAGVQYDATSEGATAPTMTLARRGGSLIYRSIPKVVDVLVGLPAGFYGTLKVKCVHPATDTRAWAVVGASATRSGANVFGVWNNETRPSLTKSTLEGTEMATEAVLEVQHVTRLDVVSPTNASDNQLTVACVAMVPTESTIADGDTISMEVQLLDSSDNEITTGTSDLTLEDTFSGAADGEMVNKTIELTATTTPSGNIGEYFFVPFQLIIPPGVHKSELALVTPSDDTRAIFTVHSIRYGAKIGLDVLGAPILSEGIMNFTKTNTNISHPTQFDTLLVNLGYITNLGLSKEVYRGKGGETEWVVDMEVELRATDHPLLHSTSTNTQKMYISLQLGDTIMVETQDITGTVVGDEKIILETQLSLTDPLKLKYDKDLDQRVGLSLMLRHRNNSRKEGEDTRAVVIFPPYMSYENDSAEFNSSSLTVLFKGSSVALVVGEMWFSDIYSINFTALIDPEFVRGRGTGFANATTVARAICRPTLPSADFARCGPMSYTMYEVSNPECSDPLLASLTDCHFAASAVIEKIGSYGPAAIKSGGWRPPVRDDPSWTSQYVEIRFGVPTRVSGWKVTNLGARAVTAVRIEASDNGMVFQEKYTGSVAAGMEKEDLGENSFNARFVRIVIVAAGSDTSSYIQITAELYGCHTDQPVEDSCPAVADNTIDTTEPRKWRHFAVDTTHDIVYYCDYDLSRDAVICFASADGSTWIGQPKYIGELRGHAAGKMYAYDSKYASTVYSEDGMHWQTVDPSDGVPDSLDPVMVVKGSTAAESVAVEQSGWQGDYYGLKKTGAAAYSIKWSKCCSN